MPSEEVIGLLYGVGSAFFYGVSTVMLKSPSLSAHKIHPVAIQLVYSIFIGLSTVPLVLWAKPSFTIFGLYAALLWTPSTTLAVFAMNALGVSYAVSLWAGVTIIVSFLWGFLWFHDKLQSLGMSVLALFIMMASLFAIAVIFKRDEEEDRKVLSQFQQGTPSGIESAGDEESASLVANQPQSDQPHSSAGATAFGVTCAVAMGFLNGTILVPSKLMPSSMTPYSFALSLAVSVAALAPLYFVLYFAVTALFKKGKDAEAKGEDLVLVITVRIILGGLITSLSPAGLFWSIGNVLAILTVSSPLGLAAGFPLTQCALVVSAIFGIFLYGELRNLKFITAFFIAAFVLVGGAFMLAIFGHAQ